MSLIAIVGAGAIGGALTHKLAARSRVRRIRLIDTNGPVASGKALDVLQSGPIDSFSTAVSGADSLHAAAGADVVAIADPAAGDAEFGDDAALALVGKLIAAGVTAPIVFAGAASRRALGLSVRELHVPAERIVGSAPGALESALRALCAVEADSSAVEVSLSLAGVPPKNAVIAWEEATISGQPVTAVLGAHRIAAVTARVAGLWPPGPYALGSAAARVVEGLASGSRRRFSCFVERGRGRAVAMPVELEKGRVKRVLEPSLSRSERTILENALNSE